MRIFIIQHKRSGKKVAVVEKTLAEALNHARWKDNRVIFVSSYKIDDLLVNGDIWKQNKKRTHR